MKPAPEFAFDRSMRSKDADGRLHVERCNISKAAVNPYMGPEIPGWQGLGLDANKIYFLLRDPEEMRKGAASFNNLPVLITHVPVSASDPRQDLIVGTTGSDAAFEAPYLKTSMAIWTAEAISLIESRRQQQLSSSYRYTPDMTAGEFEGIHYDGIMRNIVGNHVALVEVGRAGPDVVVTDENPFEDVSNMRNAKFLAGLKAFLLPNADLVALDAAITPLLAADGDEDDEEDDPENPGQKRKKPAMDRTITNEQVFQIAQDAIAKATVGMVTQAQLETACAAAAQSGRDAAAALFTAREEVRSLVGAVALDSAEAVYRFALDHLKVATEGVPPAAYGALVKAHMSVPKSTVPSLPAMDSDTRKANILEFPGLARIKQA